MRKEGQDDGQHAQQIIVRANDHLSARRVVALVAALLKASLDGNSDV